MLSEKCFVIFYAFSFQPGFYVGILNIIASIPGPSILTRLSYGVNIIPFSNYCTSQIHVLHFETHSEMKQCLKEGCKRNIFCYSE